MKHRFNRLAHCHFKLLEVDGHSVHIVDSRNSQSVELLALAYKEVYEPAFPIKEERESLEIWLDHLNGLNADTRISISILGENLDTKSPIVKALVVGYYYPDYDAGLLAYLATAPAFQGQGLGRILNNANNYALLRLAHQEKGKLGGIFIECNDPDKISAAEDTMDPAARIALYKKWGAVVLPIDYVQPKLSLNNPVCNTLKLLAYPHPKTGNYPTPKDIKLFITGLYKAHEKYADGPIEQNPDYIKMLQQIDAMPSLKASPSVSRKKPPFPGKKAV